MTKERKVNPAAGRANAQTSEKAETKSARPSRRPRNADATREVLLATAEVVFTELGFDGARVDDIAERANVNKRMIYVYFGDKLGLYTEVLRSAFARIKPHAKPPFDRDRDPQKRLVAWIREYFGFLARHPQLVRLVEWEALADGSRSVTTLQEVAREELEGLNDMLETGIATGRFRSDIDPHRTLMAIHSMCFGVLSRRRVWASLWHLDLQDPATITSVSQFLADLVLSGIGNGSPAGSP